VDLQSGFKVIRVSHRPVSLITDPKAEVRYTSKVSVCNSWSVGIHSSMSGIVSILKGVSSCEMMSMRLYLRGLSGDRIVCGDDEISGGMASEICGFRCFPLPIF